jgi:putative SOS response-associated peptidase YedK
MCYSALVNAHVKRLNLTYKARIEIEVFEALFKGRLEGNGAKVPRAMEAAFLETPKSAGELRITKYIRDFHKSELKKARSDLEAQEKRLAAAEKALMGKATKKAQNDRRIATDKIEKLRFRIALIESGEISESDSRIWPGHYAPLILQKDGERVIRPFRYLLRPMGQSAGFDRKFNGSYNARRDRLQEVFWWKSVFGRHHGVLPIRAFFENVKRHDYEKRKLRKGEEEENMILRFDPEALDEMIVPCIWDRNEADAFTLESFALITDEPNPEVAAAGHDRTPIIMKEKHLDLWLATGGKDLSKYEIVFEDKQPTFFEHAIAA